MVLEFSDGVVQPISKKVIDARDAGVYFPVSLFTWWDTRNVSILTGGPLGFDAAKAELEFVFRLSPEQISNRGTVILIDADGNRHRQKVDFAKVFK